MGAGGHRTPAGPRAVPGARDPLLSPVCAPHRGAGLSESEAEPDGEHNITVLPQAVAGRGNMPAQQSAVRLTEVRPRPGRPGGFPQSQGGTDTHSPNPLPHSSRSGLG